MASITTPVSDNFAVKIAKGSGPGAANVGAITLQPTGSHYSSIAADSAISGNLTGNITVLRNAGTGGEASIVIGGDVSSSSTITVPVLKQLIVSGTLAGDVTVTTRLDGGMTLATLGSTSVVDIADVTSSIIAIDEDLTGTFDGQLILRTGVPAGTTVSCGHLSSGSVIDLNNHSIAGLFQFAGGAGHVINGGAMTGAAHLNVVKTGEVPFSGVLELASIDSGTLESEFGNVDGQILIAGDIASAGQIYLRYCTLGSTAAISIGGNLAGHVVNSAVGGDRGDLAGSVTVGGALTGSLTIEGTLSGTIEVQGDVSGDVKCFEDVTGSIIIDGRLMSTGRILIDGLCSSIVRVKHITQALSLIRMTAGLASGGLIDINPNGVSTDTASGTLYFGSASPLSTPLPGAVTFDGQVRVNHFSGGATWSGTTSVNGCHATNAALDICICGTNSGSLRISQSGCSVQVPTTPTCSSSCP